MSNVGILFFRIDDKYVVTRASSKKIMERCFNIVDHRLATAHTTKNLPNQVDDYVQKNCRDWRMHD